MGADVKVEIFGQSYSIRSELEEKYVQELAAYIDGKMRAIAAATTTVDTQRAAVLAALAIADELHTLRQEHDGREEILREQAERCLTLVERALKQTA
jgi:cell division protein ZapA